MAQYKVPMNDNKMWRTKTYRFTTNCKDDDSVIALKEDIARKNKLTREMIRNGRAPVKFWNNQSGISLLRVRLMARGPRRGYDGKPLHSNADCCLNHEFATRYDVYVTEDSTNNHMLQRELDTGLTPGQLRTIDKSNNELRLRELEEDMRLNSIGIISRYRDGQKIYMSKEKYIEQLRSDDIPESYIARIS